jgi:hypothetical protein
MAQLSTTMSVGAQTRTKSSQIERIQAKTNFRKPRRREDMCRFVRTPCPEGDGVPLLDLEALGLLPRGRWGARRGRGYRDAALVHR